MVGTRVTFIVIALLVTPIVASAQAPATPTTTTTTRLPKLIGRADRDTITVGGMPPDRLSDILTIDVADRVADGGVIGLIAGAAAGVAATKKHRRSVPVVTAAVGLVFGGAIDLAFPHWERINLSQPSQFVILPVATFHSVGLQGSVRW